VVRKGAKNAAADPAEDDAEEGQVKDKHEQAAGKEEKKTAVR